MKQVRYPVSERALSKWARKKICLLEQVKNRYHYVFHFEGSTCNNGGVPFHADIHAVCKIGDEEIEFENGWFDISNAGQKAVKEMCGFSNKGEDLFETLKKKPQFAGKNIEKIITDSFPVNAAGCFCNQGMRNHKWLWVLSTIHYAFIHGLEVPVCGNASPAG